MTKEASLFFLDEPTSGLDSATSMSLLNCLLEVSKKGVNVVATLHQPRQEIFNLLSCLILLAPGGKIAYFGPAFDMTKHFSKISYVCPDGNNATDFVMDVLAGFVKPTDQEELEPVKDIITKVTKYWEANHKYNHAVKSVKKKFGELRSNTVQLISVKMRNSIPTWVIKSDASVMYLFLLWNTFFTSLAREMKIYERTFSTTIRTSCALYVLGFLIALLFGSISLKPDKYPNLAGPVTSAQLAFGLLIMTSGLKLYGHDYLVRCREESAGVLLLPLFLGKLIASLLETVFFPFAFLAGYYSYVDANATIWSYTTLFVLIQLAIMGLANLISISFTSPIKSLVASGTLVVLWAFGGFSPSYEEIKQNMGPLVILNYFSPFKWSFELHVIIEFSTYSPAWDSTIASTYDKEGWATEDEGLCKGMLVLYFLVTNLLAYMVLELKRDDFHSLKNIFDYQSTFEILASLNPINFSPIGKCEAISKKTLEMSSVENPVQLPSCDKRTNDVVFSPNRSSNCLRRDKAGGSFFRE